jgi:hypothetical protein
MEERKPRRERGSSPYENFDQSKAIAEETIRERREADARETQRLRELRLAGKHSSEYPIPCPFNHRRNRTGNKLACRDVPMVGGYLMINTPKLSVSHKDRHLLCQEEVDGSLQDLLDRATTHGCGTLETITAMEEVLKNLRIAYADHPHPNENTKDSNEGYAFIHRRGGEEHP